MTTILSTPTTLTVTTPGNSALARLAASMSTDSFADVPSPANMDESLFHMPTSAVPTSVLADINPGFTYCARACYDPTHKKVYINGGTHAGALCPGVEFMWTYDFATNSWTKTDLIQGSGAPFGGLHGYEHLTVHPTTGDLYHRTYGGGQVWRLPYGSSPIDSNWIALPSQFFAVNVAGAIDWWPQMNGGAGGLVVADQTHAVGSNASFTSWAQGVSVPDDIGQYQLWGVLTTNYYYWGGGSRFSGTMDPTVFYRTDTAFKATRYTNLPYKTGVGSMGGAIPRAHPNGIDMVLFPAQLVGDMHIFRAGTGQWSRIRTVSAGVPPFNGVVSPDSLVGTSYVGCTLHDLGVILIVHCNGAGNQPAMTLYKPPM